MIPTGGWGLIGGMSGAGGVLPTKGRIPKGGMVPIGGWGLIGGMSGAGSVLPTKGRIPKGGMVPTGGRAPKGGMSGAGGVTTIGGGVTTGGLIWTGSGFVPIPCAKSPVADAPMRSMNPARINLRLARVYDIKSTLLFVGWSESAPMSDEAHAAG